jgi:hypothetical protein
MNELISVLGSGSWAKSAAVGHTPLNVGYNSAEAPDAQVVHSPHGSSRAHRPDLTPVRWDFVVEHQAGIPLLMQPLRGNRSDGTACGQGGSAPMAQCHPTAHPTYLVVDSVLLERRESAQAGRDQPQVDLPCPGALDRGPGSPGPGAASDHASIAGGVGRAPPPGDVWWRGATLGPDLC